MPVYSKLSDMVYGNLEKVERFANWNNREVILEGDKFTPSRDIWTALLIDLPKEIGNDYFLVHLFNYVKPQEISIVEYDNRHWVRMEFS